jgi:hypothetical protein
MVMAYIGGVARVCRDDELPGSGEIAAGASIVKRFFGGIATRTGAPAVREDHVFVMTTHSQYLLHRSNSGSSRLRR